MLLLRRIKHWGRGNWGWGTDITNMTMTGMTTRRQHPTRSHHGQAWWTSNGGGMEGVVSKGHGKAGLDDGLEPSSWRARAEMPSDHPLPRESTSSREEFLRLVMTTRKMETKNKERIIPLCSLWVRKRGQGSTYSAEIYRGPKQQLPPHIAKLIQIMSFTLETICHQKGFHWPKQVSCWWRGRNPYWWEGQSNNRFDRWGVESLVLNRGLHRVLLQSLMAGWCPWEKKTFRNRSPVPLSRKPASLWGTSMNPQSKWKQRALRYQWAKTKKKRKMSTCSTSNWIQKRDSVGCQENQTKAKKNEKVSACSLSKQNRKLKCDSHQDERTKKIKTENRSFTGPTA